MNRLKRTAMSVLCLSSALLMVANSAAVSSYAGYGSSIADTKNIDVVIDTDRDRKPISKYIYGINSVYSMSGLTANATKQSGHEQSSYNWETNASNSGAAGGNVNDMSLIPNFSVSEQTTPALYAQALVTKAEQLDIASKYVTLQMMGYVANDSQGAVSTLDSPNRWASVRFNKNDSYLSQPDTHDNTVYIDEYVSCLVNKYGYAVEGGINGYFLDYEPERWAENYSILGMEQVTSEELLSKSVSLSNAVKKIDPSALVYGPSIKNLESYVNLCNPNDWAQYSPNYTWFIDYYLSKMSAASQQAGVRLLDVLDLHFITEANSVLSEPILTTYTPFANQARLQAPRILWDNSYTETSGVAILYKQHTPIIPTIQASIRMYYPGTKLSFSEYNFGGGSDISGGIAQADALGIFGSQEVYMACLLPNESDYEYQKSGINIYTNYDGNGSSFGNVSVYASNGGDQLSSVYASVVDGDDSALRTIMINKNTSAKKEASVTINSDVEFSSASVYSFNSESSEIIMSEAVTDIEDNSFIFEMEPLTVYMFEFTGGSIIGEDPEEPEEESETSTSVSHDEPEHASIEPDITFTHKTTASEIPAENTEVPSETTTSVSVVGTDMVGDTITEIITEVTSASTAVPKSDDNDDAEKKKTPVAVKIIGTVLVAAVGIAMIYVLLTDNKKTPKNK